MPPLHRVLTVGDLAFLRGHWCPLGQASQFASVPFPAAAQRPFLHGEHVVCELSYLPLGHFEHASFFAFTMYPGPHASQLVSVCSAPPFGPTAFWYCPSAHELHCVCDLSVHTFVSFVPAGQPFAQSLHDDLPTSSWYDPSSPRQGSHLFFPASSWNVPLAHGAQSVPPYP